MSFRGSPSVTWWNPRICASAAAMAATSRTHAWSTHLPSISHHLYRRHKQSKSGLAQASQSTRWTRCEDKPPRIGRSKCMCRKSSIASSGSDICHLPWRRVGGGRPLRSDQVLSIWKRGSRAVKWPASTSAHSVWSHYNKSHHAESSMNSYCLTDI